MANPSVDGWSLRWVSHDIKTRLRDLYCHQELVPKVGFCHLLDCEGSRLRALVLSCVRIHRLS